MTVDTELDEAYTAGFADGRKSYAAQMARWQEMVDAKREYRWRWRYEALARLGWYHCPERESFTAPDGWVPFNCDLEIKVEKPDPI